MPGTRRHALEAGPEQKTGRTGIRNFAALFFLHPIVIAVGIALVAWIAWRLF